MNFKIAHLHSQPRSAERSPAETLFGYKWQHGKNGKFDAPRGAFEGGYSNQCDAPWLSRIEF
jgi:hypothetical protein